VVTHDDLQGILIRRGEAGGDSRDFTGRKSAVRDRERSCRVRSHHRDLVILEVWLQIRGDVRPVVTERPRESCQRMIERHVVIAGDDDLRSRQLRQELARLLELPAARPLRQIAGDCHEVRREIIDSIDERGHDAGVGRAEVNV
jgi:hypothetical protein